MSINYPFDFISATINDIMDGKYSSEEAERIEPLIEVVQLYKVQVISANLPKEYAMTQKEADYEMRPNVLAICAYNSVKEATFYFVVKEDLSTMSDTIVQALTLVVAKRDIKGHWSLLPNKICIDFSTTAMMVGLIQDSRNINPSQQFLDDMNQYAQFVRHYIVNSNMGFMVETANHPSSMQPIKEHKVAVHVNDFTFVEMEYVNLNGVILH